MFQSGNKRARRRLFLTPSVVQSNILIGLPLGCQSNRFGLCRISVDHSLADDGFPRIKINNQSHLISIIRKSGGRSPTGSTESTESTESEEFTEPAAPPIRVNYFSLHLTLVTRSICPSEALTSSCPLAFLTREISVSLPLSLSHSVFLSGNWETRRDTHRENRAE